MSRDDEKPARVAARLGAGQVPRMVDLGRDSHDRALRGRLFPFNTVSDTLAVLDLPRPLVAQLVMTLDEARELGTALLALVQQAGGGQ